MAARRLRFAVVLLSFFYNSSSAVDRASHLTASSQRQSLILPLFLSPRSNSSRLAGVDNLGRRLQASAPNSRMRLYDDLLSNGYYTTRIWIGEPKQEFALIVDTGSTVTYVPCSSCKQCGKHQDPKFQPDLSSSYNPVKCNPECTCDSENAQCTYERQYAEMSSSSGVLGEDVISFGNLSQLKPQRAVFGCENAETGDLYSQHADGIMGLGRGDLSIVDQLVSKGAINDSFSLCYGGMNVGGGAMVLGQMSPPSNMVFSNSDPDRSPYYNIELKELHVAGKKLPINPSVFDGKHGTVLDSGTTYAYLPEAAFVAFKHALMKELHDLKQIRGPDPNYNDICFSGAGSGTSELSKTFPAVDMVFGDDKKYTLSPENYLFRHAKVRGAYCLGVFQNGKDPTTLLGGIVVRNTLVTYDRENSKVGFWKTNCSELLDSLHISDTSSASPPSNVEVPAPRISPAQATPAPAPAPAPASVSSPALAPTPNASAGVVITGEFQVGLITFDMSLSVKKSDLDNHISELSRSIAQELGINSSQVQLLNLTSTGNGSLIKWAIYPERPGAYFSQATAKHIVARLAEHDVQLPETFGNYELVRWNVQPPVKRSWWHEHYLAVVMSVIFVMMLGLSTYGIWFVWKWRQLTNNVHYKPVGTDAAVPEQEMQPF